MDAWLQSVVQVGALGIVAFVVYRLVDKTIPKLVNDFREELKAERTAFANELKAEREARENTRREFVSELKAMRGHLSERNTT